MVDKDAHETGVHDLTLGVIHALALVDVKALSYVQLRRLHAALTHACEDVARETEARTEAIPVGETVRVPRSHIPDKK